MLLFNRYQYHPQKDLTGKGAVSRVYKGIDANTQQPVAIKIFRINDLSGHYRPIQNIEKIVSLRHPGICQYAAIEEMEKEDSFGETEKLQVCIDEFMNAGSLVNYYQANHDLTLLKKLLTDVLKGLGYLHAEGIVHGYIKPSNIQVTETGAGPMAKITDFGMGEPLSVSHSNSFITDAQYMSPEQFNAVKFGIGGKISFNTDLWSLGVVLFETLTGDTLFKPSVDFQENIATTITGFELPEKAYKLPPLFKEIIMLCLEKDASVRVKTTEELLHLLSTDQSTENILQLSAKPSPDQPSATLAVTENTDETRMIALPKKENSNTATLMITDNGAGTDDTRVIIKPAAKIPASTGEISGNDEGDDTRIIAKPAPVQEAAASENPDDINNYGETKIIAASTDPDDTQIIAKPAAPADQKTIAKPANDSAPIVIPAPNAGDAENDTQIISGTASPQAAAADSEEDNTRIISLPANNDTASNETVDPEMKNEEDIDSTIIITKVNKEKQATVNSNGTGSDPDAAAEKTPGVIIQRREKPVVLFNRYEYLPASDLIGKGGFSRVYKAFDKKLSRWVALKIYKTGEFSDRYSPIAEIKRVVNLDHPNICRYLDIEEIENENPFGENEKIQVCVMELLDSGNFAEYYQANKNPEVLKKLINDILNGLSYLHKNGIIHRDIKPANILIKQTIEGPVAKITDFGISKKSDTDNHSTSALIVSIPYMAPEQLNAKRYGIDEKITYNLDLWSLGVTIFEVITGKALFKNSDQDNSEQIMANIMAPELPEKLNDLPEPFRNIVSHCVIKSAWERAGKAEELMVLLHTVSAPPNATQSLASQAANTSASLETKAIVSQQAGSSAEASRADETKIIAPVTNTDAASKSKVSLFDQEEKTVPLNDKKKTDYLRITIIAAVTLFILFFLYLKTCNRVDAVSTGIPSAKPADTAHKAVAPMVTATDSIHHTEEKAKQADSIAANIPNSNKPVKPADKKKEKPAEETHKHETTTKPAAGNGIAPKYLLKLTTKQTCTIKINSVDYGELQSGQTIKVYLIPGKYVLHFTNSSNSSLSSTANIEVKEENLGQVGQYKIPL